MIVYKQKKLFWIMYVSTGVQQVGMFIKALIMLSVKFIIILENDWMYLTCEVFVLCITCFCTHAELRGCNYVCSVSMSMLFAPL